MTPDQEYDAYQEYLAMKHEAEMPTAIKSITREMPVVLEPAHAITRLGKWLDGEPVPPKQAPVTKFGKQEALMLANDKKAREALKLNGKPGMSKVVLVSLLLAPFTFGLSLILIPIGWWDQRDYRRDEKPSQMNQPASYSTKRTNQLLEQLLEEQRSGPRPMGPMR